MEVQPVPAVPDLVLLPVAGLGIVNSLGALDDHHLFTRVGFDPEQLALEIAQQLLFGPVVDGAIRTCGQLERLHGFVVVGEVFGAQREPPVAAEPDLGEGPGIEVGLNAVQLVP